MKEQDHLGGQVGFFEGPVKFQQRNLQHVGFLHLHHSLLGLSFFAVGQSVLATEAPPAVSEGFHVSVG